MNIIFRPIIQNLIFLILAKIKIHLNRITLLRIRYHLKPHPLPINQPRNLEINLLIVCFYLPLNIHSKKCMWKTNSLSSVNYLLSKNITRIQTLHHKHNIRWKIIFLQISKILKKSEKFKIFKIRKILKNINSLSVPHLETSMLITSR